MPLKKQLEQYEAMLGKKYDQFTESEKKQFEDYEKSKLHLKGTKKLKDIPSEWSLR